MGPLAVLGATGYTGRLVCAEARRAGFARRVYEEFAEQARARGVVLLTAFGFDYVPGDLAARLAAEGLEPLDELVVGYSVSGVGTSRGTRRTMSTLAGGTHFAWADGRVVESRFGATSRRSAVPFGERDAVEWQG